MKGQWTHRLIPNIIPWIERRLGDVNYHLTQFLTGHGCFRSYLCRSNNDTSDRCPACPPAVEDGEHVIFHCPRFAEERGVLRRLSRGPLEPETLALAITTSLPAPSLPLDTRPIAQLPEMAKILERICTYRQYRSPYFHKSSFHVGQDVKYRERLHSHFHGEFHWHTLCIVNTSSDSSHSVSEFFILESSSAGFSLDATYSANSHMLRSMHHVQIFLPAVDQQPSLRSGRKCRRALPCKRKFMDTIFFNKIFLNYVKQTHFRAGIKKNPRAYGQPKIHKKDVPLRPIISLVGSPTYILAKILYEELASVIKPPASHVDNSFDYKSKIANISTPTDHLLVSLGVVSLFTNVPLELILESLDRRYFDLNVSHLSFNKIREMMTFLFKNTYFKFNNTFYRKTYGTPMGSLISSSPRHCWQGGQKHQAQCIRSADAATEEGRPRCLRPDHGAGRCAWRRRHCQRPTTHYLDRGQGPRREHHRRRCSESPWHAAKQPRTRARRRQIAPQGLHRYADGGRRTSRRSHSTGNKTRPSESQLGKLLYTWSCGGYALLPLLDSGTRHCPMQGTQTYWALLPLRTEGPSGQRLQESTVVHLLQRPWRRWSRVHQPELPTRQRDTPGPPMMRFL
ncbi:unnamed protein product [Trichogramma brassicae]|uniref:Reverse transcriptase domain-containing protein n=1 Tax=Trichogramma brassicae TaxID=86971 RepID=A0A6H5IS45_9HYME|nr:unnamed protein product [Trichogramma brassicae]